MYHKSENGGDYKLIESLDTCETCVLELLSFHDPLNWHSQQLRISYTLVINVPRINV